VVDAAILISTALGSSAFVIPTVADRRSLITTARAVDEGVRRLILGMRRPDLAHVLLDLTSNLTVVAAEELDPLALDAVEVLRDAPQSRNGSTTDAHILSLAWQANAEIWTHDRDFAGTGVASWSTVNLLRALALEDA
jgi:predicted nucleic acid-binding protein